MFYGKLNILCIIIVIGKFRFYKGRVLQNRVWDTKSELKKNIELNGIFTVKINFLGGKFIA